MRILIADGHTLFREALRGLLARTHEGAEFEEAGTFEGLVALCRDAGPFGLVLVEVDTPGWPGAEGVSRIVALLDGAPLVVVAADETPRRIREALGQGAVGYVLKSSPAKVLEGALALVRAGGVYVPPAAYAAEADEPPDAAGSRGALTPRQREVFERMRQGKLNKEIANELGVAESTVKIHASAIYRALGVANRTQAVLSANPAP